MQATMRQNEEIVRFFSSAILSIFYLVLEEENHFRATPKAN